jgi:hypothetical protein
MENGVRMHEAVVANLKIIHQNLYKDTGGALKC